MKKTLLFLCLLVPACLFAAPFEHVSRDCSSVTVRMSDAPQLFSQWFATSGNVSFVLVRELTDQLGMSHQTFQQYVDGVPVKGGILLVHSKPHLPFIQSVNGELLRVDEPSLRQPVRVHRAQLSDPDAEMVWVNAFIDGIYTARKAYKITNHAEYTISYVDVATGEVIKEESLISSLSGMAYTVYSGWQPIEYSCVHGVNILKDTIRNIYTVDASAFAVNPNNSELDSSSLLNYTNPNDRWAIQHLQSVTLSEADTTWWYDSPTDTLGDFYIKVKSVYGMELYTSDIMADTILPITFDIPVDSLIAIEDGIVIEVWDYDDDQEGGEDDNGGSYTVTQTTPGAYSWSNTTSAGNYSIAEAPHPCFDVHWGMERVYDYYLATFNHRGFDRNNGLVLNWVNPPSSFPLFAASGFPFQACAFGGTGYFAYGYGGEAKGFSYFVALDIMGHEFTHAVTGANGSQNLPGYGEGGALNESFGDIFGNAIEQSAKDSCDWLVGTEITTTGRGLRSIKCPTDYHHPDTYLTSPYWQVVTGNPAGGADGNDMDGVHTNCGVQNYWFYLLSQGGSGTNANGESYNITGIGMDKAMQIVYRNLLTYITAESEYPQSRNGSVLAAQDLANAGGAGMTAADVQTVKDAWNAVGVYDSSEIPSAIESAREYPAVNQILRNGQVYILRDGAVYDVLGRAVR